jgi:hypothetical protein
VPALISGGTSNFLELLLALNWSDASSDVLIFSAAFWKIADKKGMADLQIFSISAGVI